MNILLLILLSFTAFGKDCFDVTIGNFNTEIKQDTQVLQQNLTLTRNQSNSIICSQFQIYFSKGQANSYQRKAYYNGRSINYNLHSSISMTGILKQFGDAFSASEYLSGSSPQSNTAYQSSYYVSVPSLSDQNSPSPGIYTDNVQVAFYGSGNSNNVMLDSVETMTLTFFIPVQLSVSVTDEGGVFNASSTAKVLDFGFLQLGQELGADIRIVSNTPYQVKLSSLNNSKLLLSNGSATVDYSLKSNGSQVGLGSSATNPVIIGTGSSATSTSGDRYNVKVRIAESVTTKAAGLYQDVITITAIAN